MVVFFASKATPQQQAAAGFGTMFDWDIDITSGYENVFLTNVAKRPSASHFSGCDTPEIGDRLREGRFDAVLVLGWHLKSYIQGVVAAKRLGMPVLVRGDSHLQTPRSSLKKMTKMLLYPPLLRAFDAALYVGENSRMYFRHYRYPDNRLFFSPHCVDTERFAAGAKFDAGTQLRRQLGIAATTRVLLFAGKLISFKRPVDLLMAASIRLERGDKIEILVAGDGELREALRRHAALRGVPLHILGFCNQSIMPTVYAAADALVLPSDGNETWGLVANEALASGRPIIVSSECGCAPDLAVDGYAGRVFRGGDIVGLADAIDGLFTAPPSAAAIADKSRTYSPEAACDGIMEAMEFLRLKPLRKWS